MFLKKKQKTNRTPESQPFSLIAGAYDSLMRDVDYHEWSEYVVGLLCRAGVQAGDEVLDMACGTGTMALMLQQAGYRMTGADLSGDMIKQARAKARRGRLPAAFRVGDMRDLKIQKRYRAVTCLFDSINYLTDTVQLEACFRTSRQLLEKPGAFIFDFNTIYALACFWGDQTQVKEANGVVSIWKNCYHSHSRTATLDLTVFIPRGKLYRMVREVHQEKGYEIDEIRASLARAGFGSVELFGHGTLEPPHARTIRVTAVARAE